MDELDLLQRHRPDPMPSNDVVDRHRAHLLAAIAETTPTPGPVPQPRDADVPILDLATSRAPTRPGRRLAAAAAVVALIGVAAGLVALVADDGARTTTATTVPPVAPPAGECGSLPFELPLPDRFAEPTAGPSGDGPSEPAEGQLVLHSAGATGSIEVRWPSGPQSSFVTDQPSTESTGMTWTASSEPRAAPSGRQAFSMEVHDPRLSAVPQCQAMWFSVAAADPEVARLMASDLYLALGEPGVGPFGGPATQLVSGSETVVVAPEVPPCNAPPGVDHVDRVGGPVSLGRYPNQEEALRAFVESKRVVEPDPFGVPRPRATVAEHDYVETSLPDGSIAYVHREGLGVTIVYVSVGEGGFTVDRWEATGC